MCMSKVIMMCGVCGSGKTTYAKKKEQEGYIRLSIDEEIWKLYGTPDKPCGGSVDANPKTCCQTIHDCQKVVPLHYESEWQYKYV